MAVYWGGKKGELAIRLIGLVGKSVNSEPENWVGGRKWEGLLIFQFRVSCIHFYGFTYQF